MALYPVAGARIYIGGVLADKNSDFVEADFSTEVWTEIDGWELMGDLGEEPTIMNTSLINRDRDLASKGTRQVVTMENRFAILPDDAGQLACIAAEAEDDNYAIRVLLRSGAQRLFIALVANAREIGGNANTVRMLQVNLARNSNVVRVAAP